MARHHSPLKEYWRLLIKLARLLRVRAYWRALNCNVAAAIEHEKVIAGLGLNCIVDVGAHRGQFAVLVRQLYPSAHLILFEPLPDEAQHLRSFFMVDGEVEIHECALGDEAGAATIYRSARSDSSSLLPITQLQSDIFPGTQGVGELRVMRRRLAEVVDVATLKRPVLLKIDVQGYEYQVLSGCGGALTDHIDYVYVECSMMELYRKQALASEVIRYLHDRGFRLLEIANPMLDDRGCLLQADFLFRRG